MLGELPNVAKGSPMAPQSSQETASSSADTFVFLQKTETGQWPLALRVGVLVGMSWTQVIPKSTVEIGPGERGVLRLPEGDGRKETAGHK